MGPHFRPGGPWDPSRAPPSPSTGGVTDRGPPLLLSATGRGARNATGDFPEAPCAGPGRAAAESVLFAAAPRGPGTMTIAPTDSPGVRPEGAAMEPEDRGSVTRWIGQLQAGDDAAAQGLWERYFRALVHLARARLRPPRGRRPTRRTWRSSAFDSFCAAAARGRFPRLADRDDLWRVLVTITARKAADLVQHERRQKRGGGRVLDEAGLAGGAHRGARRPRPGRRRRTDARVRRAGGRGVPPPPRRPGGRGPPPDRPAEDGGLHQRGDRRGAGLLAADGDEQAEADPHAVGGLAMSGDDPSWGCRSSSGSSRPATASRPPGRPATGRRLEEYLGEAAGPGAAGVAARAVGAGAGLSSPRWRRPDPRRIPKEVPDG